MTTTIEKLSDCQADVIREIGNIGAGNAITSLSTMLNDRVNMTVPRVGIIPLCEFARMAGGSETLAACVYMPVAGDAPGHVAFLLAEQSALSLADQLLGRANGETHKLGEMECSALMEVGNILASSYLMALCELTQLRLLSSPPAIAVDMTAAILSSIASALASLEEVQDHALTILTEMRVDGGLIEGFFIYVPEPGSLSVMLRALNMEG